MEYLVKLQEEKMLKENGKEENNEAPKESKSEQTGMQMV